MSIRLPLDLADTDRLRRLRDDGPCVAARCARTSVNHSLPASGALRTGIAAALAGAGIAAWVACLDVFSRKGRGTPLPADAPCRLVTSGLFAR